MSIESIAPTVTPSLAAAHGTKVATLEEGRRIYTTQCTACHVAEPVSKYAGQWPRIVREMSVESKLLPGQERALLAYVLATERGAGL